MVKTHFHHLKPTRPYLLVKLKSAQHIIKLMWSEHLIYIREKSKVIRFSLSLIESDSTGSLRCRNTLYAYNYVVYLTDKNVAYAVTGAAAAGVTLAAILGFILKRQ